MTDEFGASYAAVIEADLALTELGDRTAANCLVAGEDPKVIWFAICKTLNVPEARWHGLNKNTKK